MPDAEAAAHTREKEHLKQAHIRKYTTWNAEKKDGWREKFDTAVLPILRNKECQWERLSGSCKSIYMTFDDTNKENRLEACGHENDMLAVCIYTTNVACKKEIERSDIATTFDHPNIVKTYGTVIMEDTKRTFIIMENCHVDKKILDSSALYNYYNSNLKTELHKYNSYATDLASIIGSIKIYEFSKYSYYACMYDIASAVQYLHTKGYSHRDVKTENVFIAPRMCQQCNIYRATKYKINPHDPRVDPTHCDICTINEPDWLDPPSHARRYICKLGDFGFTIGLNEIPEIMGGTLEHNHPILYTKHFIGTNMGQYNGSTILKLCDIYALGNLFYSILHLIRYEDVKEYNLRGFKYPIHEYKGLQDEELDRTIRKMLTTDSNGELCDCHKTFVVSAQYSEEQFETKYSEIHANFNTIIIIDLQQILMDISTAVKTDPVTKPLPRELPSDDIVAMEERMTQSAAQRDVERRHVAEMKAQ